MIRTTYKGRELKIIKARRPGHVRTFVGNRPVNHEWPGTDIEALDNLRTIIDHIDETGPGNTPHHTEPRWYAPGTYDLNHNGHPIEPGGACTCSLCLMQPEKNIPPTDPSGCGACGIPERGHARQHIEPIGWHAWIHPSNVQIKGRMKARRHA